MVMQTVSDEVRRKVVESLRPVGVLDGQQVDCRPMRGRRVSDGRPRC